MGVALFGVLATVAEIGVVGLAAVGAGLYITMVVHDLSATTRRNPSVHPSVWTRTAATTIVAVALGAALFAVAYVVATATTWQVLLFPFGIAAIGLGARLAAESHVRHVRGR